MQSLDAHALPSLAGVLPVPTYDRSRLRAVHLGVGGFAGRELVGDLVAGELPVPSEATGH